MNLTRFPGALLIGLLVHPFSGSAQEPPAPPKAPPQAPGSAAPAMRLAVADAEALALRNNPQITAARLSALASGEVTRQARSAFLPYLSGHVTGVESNPGTTLTAGTLSNTAIYERAAAGATLNQLVTDFGRTSNLVASTRFRAAAEDQRSIATNAQIILAVDQAFYGALATRALRRVAEQTVVTRTEVADRIGALAEAKLKSDLDASFARVNLAQANLLLLDAQNNERAAIAVLSALLGFPEQPAIELVDETSPFDPPPSDLDGLLAQALSRRPELAALQFDSQAAEKFRIAERDLVRPTVNGVATGGFAPWRNEHLSANYAAVGVNVEIPIFTGFLFQARAKEADLRAEAVKARLLDLRNSVVRDVRTSWLEFNTAYSRLDVTRRLLEQANRALDLAQTRYKLGLGSIVELSQAELQQTEAEIADAEARYRYRLADATLRFQIGGAGSTPGTSGGHAGSPSGAPGGGGEGGR